MASQDLCAFNSLFNLKFYRKKKNWKLHSDKESSSTETQQVLNEASGVDKNKDLRKDSENSETANFSKSKPITQEHCNDNVRPTTSQQQDLPNDEHYLEYLLLGKKLQHEDNAINLAPPERNIPHTDEHTQDPQEPLNTPQNTNTGESCRGHSVQDRIKALVKAAQVCADDHENPPHNDGKIDVYYQEEWNPELNPIQPQRTRFCPEIFSVPQDSFEDSTLLFPRGLSQSFADTTDQALDEYECEWDSMSLDYACFESGAHVRHHGSAIHLDEYCVCSEEMGSLQRLCGEHLEALWERCMRLMVALDIELSLRETMCQEIPPDDLNSEFLAGSFQSRVFQCGEFSVSSELK